MRGGKMTDGWLQVVGGIIVAVGSGILGMFHRRLTTVEEKHTALELHVEREKISRSETEKLFERIEKRLDDIWKELKAKADKH